MNDLVERLRRDYHHEAADRIEALEAALRDMVDTFQPFTMKPIGAPNSAARLDQEHQIEVCKRARAALA